MPAADATVAASKSKNDPSRFLRQFLNPWTVSFFLLGLAAGIQAHLSSANLSPLPRIAADSLPAALWPLPPFQYSRPEQPPPLRPPDSSAGDLSEGGHGVNAAPEVCRQRYMDGLELDADCAYARPGAEVVGTREENEAEAHRRFAEADVSATLVNVDI